MTRLYYILLIIGCLLNLIITLTLIIHISHICPFHYCLPHSSSLNFFTPNSQCQFNRSNLLCGQCQQDLSIVFGSSHCQHCSNIYLVLILPITVAGILLVMLLFNLNLTITDGTINAFIMYANIIGINSDVFFTDTDHVTTPAGYTFISHANLDLGIIHISTTVWMIMLRCGYN